MRAAWYGLCADLVPIIFTTSGGMGEQFQRRYWNPHWIRVAEEDEAIKIGSTVGRQEEEGILGGQIRGRRTLQTVTPA